jgi:hypothetical protein
MSQRDVERTIGKLLTDDMFRRRFFAAPDLTCWEAGLTLSRAELNALASLPQGALRALGERLDPRIRRLSLDTEDGPHDHAP